MNDLILVYPTKNNIQLMSSDEDCLLLNEALILHKTQGVRNLYKKVYMLLSKWSYSRALLPHVDKYKNERLVSVIKQYFHEPNTADVRVLFLVSRSLFKKNILKVYSSDGEPIAVVKHATCSYTSQLVDNEITLLSNIPKQLERYAPQLIDTLMLDNYKLLIQKYIGEDNHITDILSGSHFLFLEQCVSNEVEAVPASYISKLLDTTDTDISNTPFVNLFRNFIKEHSSINYFSTIEHGDFTPTNIISEHAIIDWEHGTLNGLPLFDLFYFYEKIGVDLYSTEAIDIKNRKIVDGYISKCHNNYSLGNDQFRKIMYVLYTFKISIREVEEGMIRGESGFSIDREAKIQKLQIEDLFFGE